MTRISIHPAWSFKIGTEKWMWNKAAHELVNIVKPAWTHAEVKSSCRLLLFLAESSKIVADRSETPLKKD